MYLIELQKYTSKKIMSGSLSSVSGNIVSKLLVHRCVGSLLEDLPLTFVGSAAFEEYIKISHNPRYTHVSRQTTTRDFHKHFNERRVKLNPFCLHAQWPAE